MERFLTRDAVLVLGANLIPLLGVILAGWDPFTLLMLYWFESAVIGFWIVIAISIGRQDTIDIKATGNSQQMRPGIGLGLFVAAHAGIFMFVHLFFLIGFREIGAATSTELRPDLLIWQLLFEKGLWVPLAGLFLVRGLITIFDARDGRRLEPPVIGFYLRIIVMQFVILAGGFFFMIVGGALIPLFLLVIMRTAIDVGIEGFADRIGQALSTRRAATSGSGQAG